MSNWFFSFSFIRCVLYSVRVCENIFYFSDVDEVIRNSQLSVCCQNTDDMSKDSGVCKL